MVRTSPARGLVRTINENTPPSLQIASGQVTESGVLYVI
jgi:hypothetical protein